VTGLATVAAGALAVVLAWAAIAKARDRAGTTASFAGLRLPAAAALAFGVPVVEAVVAAGLVVWPAATGWVALVLLGGFSVVIGRALARGDDVPCACFGAAAAGAHRSVSGRDLVRNAALAGLAVIATAAPGFWRQ